MKKTVYLATRLDSLEFHYHSLGCFDDFTSAANAIASDCADAVTLNESDMCDGVACDYRDDGAEYRIWKTEIEENDSKVLYQLIRHKVLDNDELVETREVSYSQSYLASVICDMVMMDEQRTDDCSEELQAEIDKNIGRDGTYVCADGETVYITVEHKIEHKV